MKRRKEVFLDTLKKYRAAIAATVLWVAVCAVVFFLYSLPLEPFLYAAVLIAFAGAVFLTCAYIKELDKASKRAFLSFSADCELPAAYTLAERDYQQTIKLLKTEIVNLQNRYETERQEDIDYYTAWVHQIKTPIAVMRMELGTEETEQSRKLETELFRIEQYVGMVLQYIRLGSNSNDLVIKDYSLDEIIRDTIRKFAPQFVERRLRLTYDGTDVVIVTDKKWFACILEQLMSNAIKYTANGGITITVENGILSIADTGIGIAPEDLPRIFEKGFTGQNGRLDKCSSGLGLYLCKKAGDLLQIPLSVTSTVGVGSRFSVKFNTIK